MAYFLAIDAGGTKADYVLADENRELGRVRGNTIKRMRVDAETATAHLDTALAELASLTGVSMNSVTCTCVGTAGNTVSLVTNWLHAEIGNRVAGELILIGDVEIALDAAFYGGPGILVLAGTGSNIAGRNSEGVLMGAGGWGPALADQGSGHRIGLAGLRAGFLAVDEGRSTPLLNEVMQFWKLESLEHMIEFANSRPAPDFSRLTELVLRCALHGDVISQSVLQDEGKDLGYLVRLMVRRLIQSDDTNTLPRIAFAGSIMEKVIPVRTALIESVREEFPNITTLDGVIDPVAGALWRARSGRH